MELMATAREEEFHLRSSWICSSNGLRDTECFDVERGFGHPDLFWVSQFVKLRLLLKDWSIGLNKPTSGVAQVHRADDTVVVLLVEYRIRLPGCEAKAGK
jgi:hypothetical protein